MPVDIFTVDQFEDALPTFGFVREFSLGARQYVFTVHVKNGMALRVYSGIGTSGVSADCGEDSIRAVVIRQSDAKVYGSKLKRWVTRQPGWRARLTDMLREMWKLALLTGPCKCGGTVGVYIVKKPGPNKGRLFRKCDAPSCKMFEWLVKDAAGALRKEAA